MLLEDVLLAIQIHHKKDIVQQLSVVKDRKKTSCPELTFLVGNNCFGRRLVKRKTQILLRRMLSFTCGLYLCGDNTSSFWKFDGICLGLYLLLYHGFVLWLRGPRKMDYCSRCKCLVISDTKVLYCLICSFLAQILF